MDFGTNVNRKTGVTIGDLGLTKVATQFSLQNSLTFP